MYRAIVPSVLNNYGLDYVTIRDVQKGYRNESYPIILSDGRIVNLLFYKREPGILERVRRADGVSSHLSSVGLPVRTRYDTRTTQLGASGGTMYVALYNYLPGQTIPWEAYTKKHIKLLGMAMSDMHEALRKVSAAWSTQYTVAGELQTLLDRMETYFKDPNIVVAIKNKLNVTIDSTSVAKLRRLVELLGDSEDQQPLHMDMVRGNVLFAKATKDDVWQIDDVALSGVIDFEKTSFGHPLFDIARTLAFLFVDCVVKDEVKIRCYFLSSGYTKRGHATYDPRLTVKGVPCAQLLDGLVALFLFHDMYKFLRHTPYESLCDNHHYTRTRNILIHRGMIRYS